MTRFSFCLLLAALLSWTVLSPTQGQAQDSPQALGRFFQSKTRTLPAPPIDFQITAGYVVIRTDKPESTGRYAITAFSVSRVAPEIYRLDMSLEKPLSRDVPTYEQPYFFTEKRTYYFWYRNGEQIIFKVGGKKVTLPMGRKAVLRVDIHSSDTYSLDRETMLNKLVFDDGSATIHLQIKFN